MLKNIRIGCFETNSSRTHSLILCSEEGYSDIKEVFAEVKSQWQ